MTKLPSFLFGVGDNVLVRQPNGSVRPGRIMALRRPQKHTYDVRYDDTGKVEVVWDNPAVGDAASRIVRPSI